MKSSWIKAILALPFNATVTIPAILFIFSGEAFVLPDIFCGICGFFIFFIGLALAIWTMRLFAKIGKGTLAPWNPTKKLIVQGPYGYVRNPMLSGVLMMILGESLIFGSWCLFGWFAAFLLVNTIYFMLSEEKGLEKRFGREYLEYKKNVPRWIPRLTKWSPDN